MTAQSKVTITLGRRGQVVKNGVASSDGMHFSGVKRPVRERLGVDNNKRQRIGNESGLNDGILGNGSQYPSNQRIEKNDLRLKLIRKGLPKRPSSDGVDLREKLLRKSLKSDINTRERERERERARKREKEREREADARRRVVSSREMELGIPSYSSYQYDKIRYMGTSMSNMEPSMKPSSSSSYILKNNDFIDGSNGKSIGMSLVPPLPPRPPLKLPEVHLTVDELLTSIGLDKYTIIFKAEEVDMSALRQMGDGDLKELGIPMGPRKKILLAVRSNGKQRCTH